MDDRNIVAAMEDAKQESHSIGLKLLGMEKLQQRKTVLDTFIAQCELVLGKTTQEPTGEALFNLPQGEPSAKALTDKTKVSNDATNWEKAEAIFIETGNKPLMITQLVQEFLKRGYELSEKNSKQVVRTALKSKPDMFANDPDTFTYWLKGYPIGK